MGIMMMWCVFSRKKSKPDKSFLLLFFLPNPNNNALRYAEFWQSSPKKVSPVK